MTVLFWITVAVVVIALYGDLAFDFALLAGLIWAAHWLVF